MKTKRRTPATARAQRETNRFPLSGRLEWGSFSNAPFFYVFFKRFFSEVGEGEVGATALIPPLQNAVIQGKREGLV